MRLARRGALRLLATGVLLVVAQPPIVEVASWSQTPPIPEVYSESLESPVDNAAYADSISPALTNGGTTQVAAESGLSSVLAKRSVSAPENVAGGAVAVVGAEQGSEIAPGEAIPTPLPLPDSANSVPNAFVASGANSRLVVPARPQPQDLVPQQNLRAWPAAQAIYAPTTNGSNDIARANYVPSEPTAMLAPGPVVSQMQPTGAKEGVSVQPLFRRVTTWRSLGWQPSGAPPSSRVVTRLVPTAESTLPSQTLPGAGRSTMAAPSTATAKVADQATSAGTVQSASVDAANGGSEPFFNRPLRFPLRVLRAVLNRRER